MNKGLKASLLLASTLLLVACGSNEATEEPKTEEPAVTESNQKPETQEEIPEVSSNYVYRTADFDVATTEQIKTFKDFIGSQVADEERVITQTNYLEVPESDARETEGDLLTGFGTLEDGVHLVETGNTNKIINGTSEEVHSKTLYLGEANIEEHMKLVDGKIYTSADSIMTLPKSLLGGTPNLTELLKTEVEPGLEGRLPDFEAKYAGKWLVEDATYDLFLNESHIAYFTTLYSYLEDTLDTEQIKVNDGKLYIELDPNNATDFETLVAGNGGYIDILYLDNGTSYIIEFDLETKQFSVIRPDSESVRTIKATLDIAPVTEANNIIAPSPTELVLDVDTYNDEYTEMFGIIQIETEQVPEQDAVEGPVNTEAPTEDVASEE